MASKASTLSAIPEIPVLRLEPAKGWSALRLAELWAYRELLFFMVWRDVKVRYKQTLLGAAWAIIQPVFTMVVFSLFFGRLAKLPSDGIPYPVFSLAGLVPWTFFAQGLAQSSDSLVGNQNLLRKVYFPRLVIPVAVVTGGCVDFFLGLIVLFCMIFSYHISFGPKMLLLPLFFLLAYVTALGVGLWLSALNVKYRDVKYVVPFLVQFWMYSTPVVYPSSLLKEPWRTIYGLNPMAGVVEGFRWAMLGTNTAPGPMLIASSVACVLLLVGGAFYFRRMERTFADVV